MKNTLTMIYWKGDRYWLGKLREHPEIMTQGETLEELEENIKDAYQLMVMDDVPAEFQMHKGHGESVFVSGFVFNNLSASSSTASRRP